MAVIFWWVALFSMLPEGLAQAAVKDQFLVEIDLTDPLNCQGPLGADPERIYLGEYVLTDSTPRDNEGWHRAIRLKSQRHDQLVLALCKYEGQIYSCSWGVGKHLELDFGAPELSKMPWERGSYVLKGQVKAGFFRFSQDISCRVPAISHSMSDEDQ